MKTKRKSIRLCPIKRKKETQVLTESSFYWFLGYGRGAIQRSIPITMDVFDRKMTAL